MSRLEQRQRRRRNSVLDEKHDFSGFPSEAESCVERADKEAANRCSSMPDGPACIKGVPQRVEKKH